MQGVGWTMFTTQETWLGRVRICHLESRVRTQRGLWTWQSCRPTRKGSAASRARATTAVRTRTTRLTARGCSARWRRSRLPKRRHEAPVGRGDDRRALGQDGEGQAAREQAQARAQSRWPSAPFLYVCLFSLSCSHVFVVVHIWLCSFLFLNATPSWVFSLILFMK